ESAEAGDRAAGGRGGGRFPTGGFAGTIEEEEETMSAPQRIRRHPRVPAPARLRFSPDAPLTDRLFVRLCHANPDRRLDRTAQGARLGWLIDPKRKVVEIYRPRRRVEVLTAPATLSGEDVLPGFVLDLKGILT